MSRTRSEAAHKKVLQAALALVAEHGIEATSMDAIARASGVSKATIYKHWADKDALLLEMLAEVHGISSRPSFDTGNTRADIATVLSYRPPDDVGIRERLTPHLVAYSARNVSFGQAWRNMVMEPPRRELRHLLKLGIERRELSPELNIDISLALLLGPIVYSYVFLKGCHAHPGQFAEAVVEAYWRAYAIK